MNELNFLDLLNAISVIVGIQNLKENREQSAHNDVQVANAEQARYLLSELFKQFDKLNSTLSEQAKMLQEILNILKGERRMGKNKVTTLYSENAREITVTVYCNNRTAVKTITDKVSGLTTVEVYKEGIKNPIERYVHNKIS